MGIRKRCLAWDYTNTRDKPDTINQLDFNGPFHSVHNWNAWIPPELKNRLPFRPMARTPAQLQGEEWGWIVNSNQPVVHFLNEPERQGVSAAAAADLWHKRMVGELRNQKHKKVVGPSVASDDAGHRWLRDFMGRVKDARPDYLGVHYYGTDAGAARAYIDGLHKEFGLPVVVTEIACTSRDGHAVENFTRDLTNWMDKQDWIMEYAWFGCMMHVADNFVSPAAQLMNKDGSFTPLMKKLVHEEPLK